MQILQTANPTESIPPFSGTSTSTISATQLCFFLSLDLLMSTSFYELLIGYEQRGGGIDLYLIMCANGTGSLMNPRAYRTDLFAP